MGKTAIILGATGLLEIWAVDLGALITVTVSLLQFWFLILGGLLLFRTRRLPAAQAASAS